jgi:Protein of unknown function (DUF1592)/Protein of unknown function (DUF1588)/Protein of unknown function (DUF1595)/Protein of unknown function (DUF1587)/Protein of unknown function (DUF1585)
MWDVKWMIWLGLVGCTATVDDGRGAPAPGQAGGGGSSAGSGGMASGGGGSGPAAMPKGFVLDGKPEFFRVVRLTHEQWENAARSLLQLPQSSGLSSGFAPDPPDGKFRNNERALYVTETLWTDYQRVAEQLAEQVCKDPAALARLGSADDSAGFIRKLGHAAYRRALMPEEEQRYTALYAAGGEYFASGNAFVDGARVVIESLLQSPHFLYRVELTPKGQRLSGAELATKLSLLFRDALPDATLLASAEQGGLADDAKLKSAASQLLEGEAARPVVERFHSQLFGLGRYASIAKDPERFPTYSAATLNGALEQADKQFFYRLFEGGQGFRDILTSRLALVNESTAPFYGLTATGSALTEVMLDESRPGFLTRLGFLAQNATLRDPDPIHRGVDITRRLLCKTLVPPAGVIPPLPDFVPGQTNRERVQAHTGEGFCGGCHNTLINPVGFAFEGFDAVGKARTTDNGKPIDTTGSYDFGSGVAPFKDAAELSALLAESPQAHGCYAANLSEFALARDVATGDGPMIAALQDASMSQRLSLKDTLLAIVSSKEFTNALGGAP